MGELELLAREGAVELERDRLLGVHVQEVVRALELAGKHQEQAAEIHADTEQEGDPGRVQHLAHEVGQPGRGALRHLAQLAQRQTAGEVHQPCCRR